MIYDIRQVTVYKYGSSVPIARHIVRMQPVSRPGQTVERFAMKIEPSPRIVRESTDFFGNALAFVSIEASHQVFRVETTARVTLAPAAPPDPAKSPIVGEVRRLVLASADLSGQSPAHFLHPSRLVSLVPAITDYARSSFPDNRPILAGAMELMQRIKQEFKYEPGATDVTTPPAEAFADRLGVCQDFAHVMIAGLRGLGLPAAYVSGYLRTIPPPGKPRLAGSDATHAWVGVWCGAEIGWVGLDPTNALIARGDHIVLAIGRDYADVSPIDGVIVASGAQSMAVAVDVIPHTDTRAPPVAANGSVKP